ncbi:hypothetical protein FACS189487_03900 [Campylobacterota bacterium]|nr:hypothetical protein FACS189487_03900 [Campylobacterota bacterium]
MSISEAVKNTLAKFRQTQEAITPENYRRVFCTEAKKLGLNLPECHFVERALDKLSIPLKKRAIEYRIRTQEELAIFLTTSLNRVAGGERADAAMSAAIVIRRLLSIIELLPLKNISAEAKFSLSRDLSHPLILHDEQERWARLSAGADLGALGEGVDLAPIASVLAKALKIAMGGASSRADDLCAEITKEPQLLTALAVTQEIEELLKYSPALKLGEHTRDLELIVRELSENLNAQNEENCRLESEMKNAGETNESGDFWNSLKESFLGYAQSLRSRTETINSMQNRIAALETELKTTRAKAYEDAVTHAPNRRAINEAAERFETAYKNEKQNYAAAFLEIDAFEALLCELDLGSFDEILSIVARYLGRSLPANAAYGHYISQTFLVIFPCEAKEAIANFLKNLVKNMATKRFVYGNRSFFVTLSAGFAFRSSHKSENELLSAANAALVSSKLSGGNRAKCNDS